jgi:ubiquinone/menaquinone biosynthesis C-methylase UbiE
MTKKLKLYTDLASLYDEIYQKIFPYKEGADLVDKICKKFKIKKILEVGCGTGHLAKLIKGKGYDIIGTDLYNEMLIIARKNVPNVKFLKQDMRNLKFKQKFDAVVCLGRSFTYMTTNEDVENTLKSFNKVLKNGGILIFDNFNGEESIRNFEKKYRRMTQKIKLKDKVVIRKNIQSWNLKTGITWNWNCTYIIKKGNKIIKEYKDSSILRGFLKEELDYFLKNNGFKIVKFYPKEFLIVAKKV